MKLCILLVPKSTAFIRGHYIDILLSAYYTMSDAALQRAAKCQVNNFRWSLIKWLFSIGPHGEQNFIFCLQHTI